MVELSSAVHLNGQILDLVIPLGGLYQTDPHKEIADVIVEGGQATELITVALILAVLPVVAKVEVGLEPGQVGKIRDKVVT